jgi:hypothetical protein
VKRDVARVFVALQSGASAMYRYYSLSAASFQRDNLPADQAKRLPRYPVPAVLLGRLAVDDGAKGKGLGAFLLMDALNRTLLATQALAVHAMIVDARDDAAAPRSRSLPLRRSADRLRRGPYPRIAAQAHRNYGGALFSAVHQHRLTARRRPLSRAHLTTDRAPSQAGQTRTEAKALAGELLSAP